MDFNKSNDIIKLIFPWPPSVNTMYMQGKGRGQKFPTKKLKEFKRAIAHMYTDSSRIPLQGRIRVRLEFIPGTARSFDLDNFKKAVLDGLTQLRFIEDDSQVYTILGRKNAKISGYNKGAVLIAIKRDPEDNRDMRAQLEQYINLNNQIKNIHLFSSNV